MTRRATTRRWEPDTLQNLEAAYEHLDRAIKTLERVRDTAPMGHVETVAHFLAELTQVNEGDGIGTDSGFHDYVGNVREQVANGLPLSQVLGE